MENSMQSLFTYLAVVLTGLSAGFFYAWAVSVIPGTQQVCDGAYVETMQAINRAILNPAFYLIFFGPLLLLIVSTLQQYQLGLTASFWFLVAACLTYFIGTFGVTVFGNVPLNEALDIIQPSELSTDQLANIRQQYEVKWNQLHTLRTVFSVLSFMLSLAATFKINQHF